MMSNYKLVALDLDGTLFNNSSQITEANLHAIRRITDAGIHAVISTGRPLSGIPFEQINGSGIDYAITANGSAIYRLSTNECIRNEAMDEKLIAPILDFLLTKDIHMDAFIDGKGYSPQKCAAVGQKLPLPQSLKKYVIETRIRVDDLPAYIHDHQLSVQKMTLNFYRDEQGTLVDREPVRLFLENHPAIATVCGGYNNLEFTRADVSKGTALRALSDHLHIDIADTIAIGDTENDLAILQAAGVGVAMANATPAAKEASDYITSSNEEDGVAAAICHFFPELFD